MEITVENSYSTFLPTTSTATTGCNLTTTNATESSSEFVFDDYTQRVIVATAVICTSLLGICGNSLVILSVMLSRKLRTASNVFIVNLACSDLLTSLHTPWNAVALLSRNGWPLPAWICTAAAGIMFVCVGCSLYNLASIAIDRYIVITRVHYRIEGAIYPRYIMVVWIALTWLLPVMIFIVPPLNRTGGLGFNAKYHSCSQLSSSSTSNTYDVITSIGLYPIPLIIIMTSYITIYVHIRRHGKYMMTMTNGGEDHDTQVTTRVKERQVQITKNMFLVVCAFYFCITPYGISLVFDASDPVVPYVATMVLMNACINPLIYAKHPLFKDVYKKMLTCRWREVIGEGTSQRMMRMKSIASRRSPNYIAHQNNSNDKPTV